MLSFNELSSMEGLTSLTRLTSLDLSFNAVTRIQGLKVGPPLMGSPDAANHLSDLSILELMRQCS